MTVLDLVKGVDAQHALELLAPLFCYPDASYFARLRRANEVLLDEEVANFASEVSGRDLTELQSIYTLTFDLAPACSPYLGIHLFGDESRDRGRLMLGLRMSYRRHGCADDSELPDHIAEVLRFATRYAADEWSELRRLVLVPSLTKMNETLRSTSNPYRHLVAAALGFSQVGGAV